MAYNKYRNPCHLNYFAPSNSMHRQTKLASIYNLFNSSQPLQQSDNEPAHIALTWSVVLLVTCQRKCSVCMQMQCFTVHWTSLVVLSHVSSFTAPPLSSMVYLYKCQIFVLASPHSRYHFSITAENSNKKLNDKRANENLINSISYMARPSNCVHILQR